ncbi:MAG TPA: hypothetical protein VI197_32105 [Polyangiaceae bacterium]
MTASQDSSKVHWLLAKGLGPTGDTSSAVDRSRKLKLRLLVASIVGFCTALTLLGAVLSWVNH